MDISIGDTIKIKTGKSCIVIAVINIHNIQVMFQDGSIMFYCMDSECEFYDGENFKIFKK